MVSAGTSTGASTSVMSHRKRVEDKLPGGGGVLAEFRRLKQSYGLCHDKKIQETTRKAVKPEGNFLRLSWAEKRSARALGQGV